MTKSLFSFVPPHYQMVASWWIIVGFGFGGSLVMLAAVWGEALRRIGSRLMETREFFDLVVRYAREKQTKRVMGMDE